MTDLATRVEQTVPLPPDLCAEVALRLGWTQGRSPNFAGGKHPFWANPSNQQPPITLHSPPDFNSLDVVLRHTPEGARWDLFSVSSVVQVELFPPHGVIPLSEGASRAEVNARLAAIIRAAIAQAEGEGT